MKFTKKKGGTGNTENRKNVIITSGDASDFDGFKSLVLYFVAALKHNCDVAFVMNYPAYYRDSVNSELFTDNNKRILDKSLNENETSSGLGYAYDYEYFAKVKYDKNNVTGQVIAPLKNLREVVKGMPHFSVENNKVVQVDKDKGKDNKSVDISVMTFITKYIVEKIWEWCISTYKTPEQSTPKLWFCTGGINTFNPFSAESIKDENMVYGPVVNQMIQKQALNVINSSKFINKGPNAVNQSNKSNVQFGPGQNMGDLTKLINEADKIYIDMNGSMAWYDTSLSKENIEKVQAAFVMGGVLDYSQVNTLGATSFLNRLSCATMNQLYHAQNTARFFNDFKEKLYFITNNEINANFNFVGLDIPYDNFKKSMANMGLIPMDTDDDFIDKVFDAYYLSRPGDRKPFDVISSLGLVLFMDNKINLFEKLNLVYNSKYGITILGTGDDSTKILNKFISEDFGMFGKDFTKLNPFNTGQYVEKTEILPNIVNQTATTIFIQGVKSLFVSKKDNYVDTIKFYLNPKINNSTLPIYINTFASPKTKQVQAGGFFKTSERVSILGRANAVVYKIKGDRKKYVKVKGSFQPVSSLKPKKVIKSK